MPAYPRTAARHAAPPGAEIALWHATLVALSRKPADVPDATLRKQARRVRVEAREAASFEALAARTLAEVGRGWPDDATLAPAATARLAAVTAAWAASHFAVLRPIEEVAVLALLTADAPRLVGRTAANDDGEARHAWAAAAWLGAVADFPVAAARAVARHHERTDGTGLPARLAAADLSRTDRFVAVAARLAELAGPAPHAAAWRDAGAALEREARCGELDLTLAAALLESLTITLGEADALLDERPRLLARTDLGRRRLRFETAHAPVPTPHIRPIATPHPAVARPAAEEPILEEPASAPRAFTARVDIQELIRSERR